MLVSLGWIQDRTEEVWVQLRDGSVGQWEGGVCGGRLERGHFSEDLLIQAQGLRRLGRGLAGLGRGGEGGRAAIDRHETKLLPLLALTPHHIIRRALPPPWQSLGCEKSCWTNPHLDPQRASQRLCDNFSEPRDWGFREPCPWHVDIQIISPNYECTHSSVIWVNSLYKSWSLCWSQQNHDQLTSFRELKLLSSLRYQRKVKSDQTLLHTFRVLWLESHMSQILNTLKTNDNQGKTSAPFSFYIPRNLFVIE